MQDDSRLPLAVTTLLVMVAALVVALLVLRWHDIPVVSPSEETEMAYHTVPSEDPSYWTEDRMRSAVPAPMPTEPWRAGPASSCRAGSASPRAHLRPDAGPRCTCAALRP